MTQDEKIKRLKKLLSHQIKWYKKTMLKYGEDWVNCFIDTPFEDLSNDEMMAIIALLI